MITQPAGPHPSPITPGNHGVVAAYRRSLVTASTLRMSILRDCLGSHRVSLSVALNSGVLPKST